MASFYLDRHIMQWHSQVELVGCMCTIELVTVLIDGLTVLLEYIDLFIPVTGHAKLIERKFLRVGWARARPGPPLATSLDACVIKWLRIA